VFDLMERTFSEIAPQVDFCYDHCELVVHHGFLSFYALRYQNITGCIWVMEEYKVQSSWTKCNIVTSLHCTLICCTKSGDIVGIDGGELVKFNNNGEVQEHRSYCDYRGRLGMGCDVVTYTESLFSLHDDN
jgi:hypothetical protein